MFSGFLHDLFARVSGVFRPRDESLDPATMGLRPDRMVNYVWIDKDYTPEPSANDLLSSVPLHYLDKAFDNARKYPDTMVNIWIDDSILNQASRFMVQSHIYFGAPPNVVLRDLGTIPEYAQSPRFQPYPDKKPYLHNFEAVFLRADNARFLVLDHCLTNTNAREVFYADFDLEDVDLDNPVTKEVLGKRGMALARVPAPDYKLASDPSAQVLAHGYIAVNRSGRSFLRDRVLPELRNGYNAFSPFGALTLALLKREMTSYQAFMCEDSVCERIYESYMTNVKIHPVGTVMEQPPLYAELGLSAYRFRG